MTIWAAEKVGLDVSQNHQLVHIIFNYRALEPTLPDVT